MNQNRFVLFVDCQGTNTNQMFVFCGQKISFAIDKTLSHYSSLCIHLQNLFGKILLLLDTNGTKHWMHSMGQKTRRNTLIRLKFVRRTRVGIDPRLWGLRYQMIVSFSQTIYCRQKHVWNEAHLSWNTQQKLATKHELGAFCEGARTLQIALDVVWASEDSHNGRGVLVLHRERRQIPWHHSSWLRVGVCSVLGEICHPRWSQEIFVDQSLPVVSTNLDQRNELKLPLTVQNDPPLPKKRISLSPVQQTWKVRFELTCCSPLFQRWALRPRRLLGFCTETAGLKVSPWQSCLPV